ncbi:hypothetical protein GSY74_03260, partial [Sulfurovum sp. bin170]|uniref:polysaccharide deacetylase family protein n=1 Tax=Sulfurovum sp. bin170 TaxID=2695268 RepID=UPI00141891AD
RRILFVHVDGDGFVERVRVDMEKFATEYLIENIYQKYHIPQTVSIIQGEVDKIGMSPKLSSKMKKIIKELYQIPWIEPASHTLSHPFIWEKVMNPNNKLTKQYHLALPNYYFSLEKETKGSIEFALSFAPKYKRQEKILFWSGDCIPTKEVLAFVEKNGILAMNGGDTTIQKSDPWLGHTRPFGIQREDYWQVYTAQQNENVYTNEWTNSFWGYRNVIETFKMTDKPRRFKPINIYYHLYSGSRVASLKALDEVYSWAVKQKTSKLYASQYIKKARGFYRTAIAKVDGGYEIRNSGYLRTVRFDKKVIVDIERSQGVAGYIYDANRTYITLDRSKKYKIVSNPLESETLVPNITRLKPNSVPYLIDSNGWVEKFTHNSREYNFHLKSNISIEANFYIPSSCRVDFLQNYFENGEFTPEQRRQSHPISSSVKDKNRLSIISNKKGIAVAFQCK